MSGFGYPGLLALLVLVPLMAIYYILMAGRDRRARESFAKPGRFASLNIGQAGWRAALVPALVTCAVLLASLSIARPLGPPEGGGERTVSMDVIVALDISDSMGVTDVAENRLAAAKGCINRLAAAAPANRYGLVLFSGDAIITCPPTLDHDAFLTFMDDAGFTRANLPGTAMGEGILTAATRFKKGDLPRAVLVVSDGENTYGAEPAKAAATAKEKGLKVFTVGVGTGQGGPIPNGVDFFGKVVYKRDKGGRIVNSALDEGALKDIAAEGGGKYFNASDAGAVRDLAGELTVKTKKAVDDPFKGAKEYGPFVALAAALVLAAALII